MHFQQEPMKRGLILFCVLFVNYCIAQENRSVFSTSGISERTIGLNNVIRFDLEQNNPNPFYDFTNIAFSTPAQGFVELKIVNLIGKEVIRRVIEADAGRNVIHLDREEFSPGVYVYSLSNGNQTLTRRMIVSRK